MSPASAACGVLIKCPQSVLQIGIAECFSKFFSGQDTFSCLCQLSRERFQALNPTTQLRELCRVLGGVQLCTPGLQRADEPPLRILDEGHGERLHVVCGQGRRASARA